MKSYLLRASAANDDAAFVRELNLYIGTCVFKGLYDIILIKVEHKRIAEPIEVHSFFPWFTAVRTKYFSFRVFNQ